MAGLGVINGGLGYGYSGREVSVWEEESEEEYVRGVETLRESRPGKRVYVAQSGVRRTNTNEKATQSRTTFQPITFLPPRLLPASPPLAISGSNDRRGPPLLPPPTSNSQRCLHSLSIRSLKRPTHRLPPDKTAAGSLLARFGASLLSRAASSFRVRPHWSLRLLPYFVSIPSHTDLPSLSEQVRAPCKYSPLSG